LPKLPEKGKNCATLDTWPKGGQKRSTKMQMAIAKATVGRANTTHLVLVEVLENNQAKAFGVNCGSRIIGSGFYLGERLTRTIDSNQEKFYTLFPEAVEKLAGSHDNVCQKCYARAVA
jgi:hypothetical protein